MASKHDIKQAAFKLFAIKGFEATTTSDIASAVGLKKQSLYSHFSSKNEIYLEILSEKSTLIETEIHHAVNRVREYSTEDFLREVLEHIIAVFSEHELLLIWKRSFIMHSSGNELGLAHEAEWKFDLKLKDLLISEFRYRSHHLSDPVLFRDFFMSYMALLHGYLDWLLISRHSESVWQNLWQNFWAGCGGYLPE